MDDQVSAMQREPTVDPLIAVVEKKLLEHAPASVIVATVLRQLADDVPEHYGPHANRMYRRWLIRRSQLAQREVRYVPPVLAQSW